MERVHLVFALLLVSNIILLCDFAVPSSIIVNIEITKTAKH